MSPTTLYREGADLDDLLAELDSEYPGQVQVLEITHPREGGVLGFFAKQRVGVHYRLAQQQPALSAPMGRAVDGFVAALGVRSPAAARGAEPAGIAANPERRAPMDDVAAAPTGRRARPALGPDPAVLEAALSGRAQTLLAERPSADAGPGENPGPDADFAEILAEMAVRKAAAASGVVDSASDLRALLARASGRTTSTVPSQRTSVEDVVRQDDVEEHPAGSTTAHQPPIPAPVAAAADTIVARTPGLQPGTTQRAAASVPATVRPAFETLPQVTADGDVLRPWHPDGDAPQVEQSEAQARAEARGRPAMNELNWNFGEPDTSAGAYSDASSGAFSEARPVNATPSTVVITAARDTGVTPAAAAVAAPESTPPVTPKIVLTRRNRTTDGANLAPTLRRRLLAIGVAESRMPTAAAHLYEAIEQLVQTIPPSPGLPTGPGRMMVLLGPTRDAITAASDLLRQHPNAFESVWTFGCEATGAASGVPFARQTITSVAHAAEIASVSRATAAGPTLVVIDTSAAHASRIAELIATIDADAVWAIVDATRKSEDTARTLARFGRVDGLVVMRAEVTTSPATVWDLQIPIASVDGRPSSRPAWAVLLLDKLTGGEDEECSDAPF